MTIKSPDTQADMPINDLLDTPKKMLDAAMTTLRSVNHAQSNFYYLDLLTGRLMPYFLNEKIEAGTRDFFSQPTDFATAFTAYVNKYVDKSDREIMLAIADEKKLGELLAEYKTYSRLYRVIVNGERSFCEISVTKIGEDNEAPNAAILSFTDKDEEIMSRYIEGRIMREYISAFMVDLDNDTFRTFLHSNKTRVMDRDDRCWSKAINAFSVECEDVFQPLVQNLGDVNFLRMAMQEFDRREFIYRVNSENDAWRRAVIRVIDRREGKPCLVLACFKIIDSKQAQEFDLKEQLAEKNKTLDENWRVISVLSEDYSFVGLIDKNELTDMIIPYYMSETARRLIGQDYQKSSIAHFKQIIRKFIVKEDWPEFDRKCKRDLVLHELQLSSSCRIDFRLIIDGKPTYYRMKFSVNKDDKNMVVVGLLNVDNEVKRELKLGEMAGYARARVFTEAFLSSYTGAYYIDLANDRSQPFKCDIGVKDLSEIDHYTDVMTAYIERYVHEDDREKVRKALIPENIRQNLKKEDRYILYFRDIAFEIIRWLRLEVIKGGDADHAAVSFTDVTKRITEDERIKNELADNLSLIRGVASEYSALYRVDLRSGLYRNYFIDETRSDTQKMFALFPKFRDLYRYMIDKVVHPDDRALLATLPDEESVRKALAHKKRASFLFRRYYNGEYLWNSMDIIKFEDVDEDAQIIAVGIIEKDEEVRDEQRKKMELAKALDMAQAASRAKTTFLNNMSHDIRTPMNAIIGFTGLAISHIDNKEQVQSYLSKISQSSNHLLSLINDVLDMSRIESGNMSINEKEENISDIIRTLRDIVQADIHAKQLEFFVDTVDVNNEHILCDKLRLNQVLLNILSNAIKYTPSGGTVTLRIAKKAEKKSGYGTFEFCVRDNGMGMKADFLKTIYDPFTRAKSSTVSGIQGTGLGMAITKNIIDMMGGEIAIESEPGKGTSVNVTFDFKLSNDRCERQAVSEVLQADDKSHQQETGSESEGIIKDKSILLVDDNELNREIAYEILSDFGAKVAMAEDGDIAVDIMKNAQKGDFDLILMDIQMPTLNGYEATKQIRALSAEVSQIPIIAMTANAFEEDKKAALAAGMNAHIAKPIDIELLKNTLKKYLL